MFVVLLFTPVMLTMEHGDDPKVHYHELDVRRERLLRIAAARACRGTDQVELR